jgi:pimeloyl-ACP methyl ester carboxylesterase
MSTKDSKVIRQLEKYHRDKTDRLFQNWQECWFSAGFNNWNIESKLPKIQCLSLIMQGEKDEYATQKHCTGIAGKIENTAVSIIVKGYEHFPHKENSSLIAQTINFFLNKRS